MSYILYNLTHLIPRSAQRTNFGIVLAEDGRTLNPGRYKIYNTLTEQTKRYAKKRIIHNGIEYEILRIVETVDMQVNSPADRKLIEEQLNKQAIEIEAKDLKRKMDEENARQIAESAKLRKKQEDYLAAKEGQADYKFEIFQKNEQEQEKFINDGIPKEVKIEIEPVFTPELESMLKQDKNEMAKLIEEAKVEESKPVEPKVDKKIEESMAMQETVKKEQGIAEEKAKEIEIPEKITFDAPIIENKPKKKRNKRSKKAQGEAQEIING